MSLIDAKERKKVGIDIRASFVADNVSVVDKF
jgi:hypothetical protein